MSDSTPDLYTDLADLIRAAGARATPARLRVLSLLRLATSPLSHAEIETQLASEAHPGIDRVTLYRVLDWFVEADLAHKTADLRGIFRFSASMPSNMHTKHAHFRCTDCGGVTCLDEPVPETLHLPRGFRIARVELDILGKCAGCIMEH